MRLARLLIFFLSAALFIPSFGCGLPEGLTSTDGKLNGQWVAEKLNAQGDRILLTLTPGNGEREATIVAIRPAGDSYQVTAGHYSIDGNQLAFELDEINNFASPFTVNSDQLTLGTEVYFKVKGSLDGPQLGGKIQISESALNESVSLTIGSVDQDAPFVPGVLLVREPGSTLYKRVVIEEPRLQALSVDSDNLAEASGLVLENKLRLRETTLLMRDELSRLGYSVTTNAILSTHSIPNDIFFEDQWNLNLLNMSAVWNLAASIATGDEVVDGDEVIVAVIDTGIRPEHPDLAGHVLFEKGYDWVEDSISDPSLPTECQGDFDMDSIPGKDTDPTDPGDRKGSFSDGNSWHGTHVSGTVAASLNNGTGIAGISSNVKILPLRTMGRCGNGSVFSVADAILYAATLPNMVECDAETTADADSNSINEASCAPDITRPQAKVINLSLGEKITAAQADPICSAIAQAIAKGSLVVSSAGNFESSATVYPAACPGVVSVGALIPSGDLAKYSSFGPNQYVVAPGGSSAMGILSTVYSGVSGGYGELRGTSQAAAHVSGVAALLFSEKPTLTVTEARNALKDTAIDLGTAARDDQFGYGLVNPLSALSAVTGAAPVGPPAVALSNQSVDFGPLGASTKILIFNAGSGTCSGLAVSEDAGWLTPSLSGTTAPAQLTLQVNRSGLTTGPYSGTVTVTSSCGSQMIAVAMTVGSTDIAGEESDTLRDEIDDFLSPGANCTQPDVGEVICLLIDANSGDPKYFTRTDKSACYRFQFGGIAPASYLVLCGIDENLDGQICADGEDEGCFAHPNLVNPEPIEVTSTTKKNDLVIVY
jgi:serine protease